MNKKKLVVKYFIAKDGKFLDKDFQFTKTAPFDDDVYFGDAKADAEAVIAAHTLTNAQIVEVPRFVA